jgi:hypothetical protein
LFGFRVGELVEVDEAESVGPVGVAGQRPGSVGDEHLVVAGDGAHRGEVRDVVGASPAARLEMVDVEAVADLTPRDPAMPVT